MIMELTKTLKLTTISAIALLFLSQAALAQDGRTKNQLLRENAGLKAKVDSLMIELESLKSEMANENRIASEMIEIFEESEDKANVADIEYTQETTDSLLNLWYVHRLVDNSSEKDDYDMDSVRFTTNVSDEVLKQRLEKMNSYITLPFNETVKNYMVLYSEKMPTKMSHILGLSTYYLPIFEETFNKYNLPEELKIMAIIESALNPVAVSRAGAKGMWQFMHNTGKIYGLKINSFVDERMDVEKAADAAARYLLDSYNIFGDWCLAISSYNCGSGNVNKAIKRAGGKRDFWSIYPYLPRETRGYVPAFVGALYAMTYYKEYGLVPEAIQMPAHTDTFEIHRNLHFKQINEVIGIPMEELKNLNPQYIHDIIPGNEGTYILKLPFNYTNAFLENQDSLYTHKAEELLSTKVMENIQKGGDENLDRITYRVKKGDVLGRIASRYGVSVRQLQQWNHIRGTNIRIGQVLVIYRRGSAPKAASSTSAAPSTASKSSSSAAPSASASSAEYTKYTVKKGDTLYSIAQKYPGISAENIMEYNNLSSTKITVGKVLKIPNK